MKQNPQTPKIILVDRWEMDAGGRGTFLKAYKMGNNTGKQGNKREWRIWQKDLVDFINRGGKGEV